jgi:hypothetical protein
MSLGKYPDVPLALARDRVAGKSYNPGVRNGATRD